MQTKKEKGTELEWIVVSYLKPIDKHTRPTRGSGNGTEIGDVLSKHFYIECKNWNKKNIIIDQDIWQKLINQLPISTIKPSMLIQKNTEGKIFVSMEIKDFFNIVYKGYEKDE